MNYKISLILILSLAFLLRIINIGSNPPALYGDELTMVLDVNSILKTGADTTGKFLPLNFSMGGGRPVGYGYFSIPFVALFGPNALSIRLLSVLSGVGIVFLIFWLGKILLSKQVGLIAAILTTISPWDLSLSRGGFETHFALFLTLLGVVTFIASSKRPWLILVSAFSFGLSIHTYSTYKLTIPLLILLLLWYTRFKNIFDSKRKISFTILASLILILFAGVLVWQIILGNSEQRFLSINVFNQNQVKKEVTQKINLERQLDSLPTLLSLAIHNKPIEYGGVLINSYLEHLSTEFLFLHGDRNPRHNLTQSGQLYIIEIISLLFGLLFLARQSRKIPIFISLWLLLSIIPATLLGEIHALRDSLMLPPLILISASGLFYIWSSPKIVIINILRKVILIGFFIQFLFIFDRLYFLSPREFSRFWAYPAKVATEMAVENKMKYDFVVLSDRIDNIEFAYPLYAKIDPKSIISQNLNKTNLNNRSFKKFDNVYIGHVEDENANEYINSLPGFVLYIGPADSQKFIPNSITLNGLDNLQALVVKKKE